MDVDVGENILIVFAYIINFHYIDYSQCLFSVCLSEIFSLFSRGCVLPSSHMYE